MSEGVLTADLTGIRILQLCRRGVTLERFLLPLVDHLQSEGAIVECACVNDDFAEDLRSRGYCVHAVEIEPSANPARLCAMCRGLQKLILAGQYDVVHTHTSVTGLLGNLAARRARVPKLLYTQHGSYVHGQMSAPVRWFWTAVESRIVGLCDKMICVSEAERRLAMRHHQDSPDKFVVTPGVGVDVGRFRRSPEQRARLRGAIRKQLGLSPGARAALIAAWLVRDKGYFELIEAWRLLAARGGDFHLLVAGVGPEHDRLRRAAEEAEVADRVHFLGWREDVPELHCAVDVFALPSYHEGMPVSTMEAMASGLPVVATDIPGCREQIVHGETGYLVPVAEPGPLADGLWRVLTQPELAAKMGRAGQVRADLFDVGRVMQIQMDLYREQAAELRGAGR